MVSRSKNYSLCTVRNKWATDIVFSRQWALYHSTCMPTQLRGNCKVLLAGLTNQGLQICMRCYRGVAIRGGLECRGFADRVCPKQTHASHVLWRQDILHVSFSASRHVILKLKNDLNLHVGKSRSYVIASCNSPGDGGDNRRVSSLGSSSFYPADVFHPSIVSIPGLPDLVPQYRLKDHNRWLRDVLSHQVPSARIMSFYYDFAKISSSASWKDLTDQMLHFLFALIHRREDISLARRPLVFICFSFGSIILKKV
jgi:hypothetical protein